MDDLSNSFNTSVSANIKSGIDKMGLLGALVGGGALIWTIAATNAWNPIGIAAAIIGAITFLISAFKSIIGMFSKNKRAQYQKEEVMKTLDSIEKNILKALSNEEDKIFEAIEEEGEKIKNALEDKIREFESFIERLDEFIDNIEKKQRDIKLQGGLL